jgi:hypothetical protein
MLAANAGSKPYVFAHLASTVPGSPRVLSLSKKESKALALE